jgi:nitroreductase
MATDGAPEGDSQVVLDFLLNRRSSPVAALGEPGPTTAQLELLVAAASRVPDHGQLQPWRFIVYRGPRRVALGEALANLADQMDGPLPPTRRAKELARFSRAPVVVGVISSPKPSEKIPIEEMLLSAGAAAMALSLAANALGFGSCWITNWYSHSAAGRALLGLAPHERVAGFVHLGTLRGDLPRKQRPPVSGLMTEYSGPWEAS